LRSWDILVIWVESARRCVGGADPVPDDVQRGGRQRRAHKVAHQCVHSPPRLLSQPHIRTIQGELSGRP
jgi:hypothetical protein